ncbi:MAG: UDP-N-acetylmuramoyl-tripeptide--D-alanyl-D-alanine ligase [Candidatus Babeliales bacterium]
MISPEQFIRTTLPEAKIEGAVTDLLFSIDTRTLQPGEIFVALEGGQTDGHLFIREALLRGASGIMIAASKRALLDTVDQALKAKSAIIIVPNPSQALLQLAQSWRAQFSYSVICVTGSVGKTSTKESIAHLLSCAGWRVHASVGNQNTLYGLALNILRMRPEHQVAIFELGISKPGEMARLAAIARPTIGVITGVGHAHMEALGSVQHIAAEKRDIFKYFGEDNIGIVNGDQAVLAGVAYNHPIIKFGSKTTNQIQARKIEGTKDGMAFTLKWYGKKQDVCIAKRHSGAVFNSLATVAVGHLLNVDDEVILRSIQEPIAIEGRFQECRLKDGKGILINDCYNANPESMKAALIAFQNMEVQGTKIAVIGDMLELGQTSPFWHRQIGRFMRKAPAVRTVILVGSLVKWTQKTLPLAVQVTHVSSWQEAVTALESQLQSNAVVLVKGSHGMQLQKMVDLLVEKI